MGVSENGATPKSSILIGVSIINYKPSILGYQYFWKHPYTNWGMGFPPRFLLKKNGWETFKWPRLAQDHWIQISREDRLMVWIRLDQAVVPMFHSQLGRVVVTFKHLFSEIYIISLWIKGVMKGSNIAQRNKCKKSACQTQVNGTLPPPSELWLVQSSTRTHDVFGICTHIVF